jgi:thiosulfate/3-mercaptopyruvate sulfurtransferase
MADQLVGAEWLSQHLEDENLVIVDCRFDLKDTAAGRAEYEKAHIPGAVYFDLKKDLSGPKREHGGRHPLPDLDSFVKKLGEAGIDKTIHVVVYDDQNGSYAARLWWMLNYLGHENVSVLDVGFSTWVKEGFVTSSELPRPKRAVFHPDVHPEMVADVNEVRRAKDEDGVVLIDSRAPERYRGENEPIDPKAGHIPGAMNRFWKDNVAESGRWKAGSELEERFRSFRNKDVIIYCGSGVTANANILALKATGKDARLYVGSWSDWSSYPEHPIETGDGKS